MNLLGWLGGLVGSEIPAAPHEPGPPALTPVDPIARALSPAVLNHGVYRLGKGGRRPLALMPFDADGYLDCSGYVSWCLGLDRYQPGRIGGDWISTDTIVRDVTGPRAMFAPVPAAFAGSRLFVGVRPGDLVVYAGRVVAGVRVAIGHVGVVVEAPHPLGESAIGECRVAHCAASRNPAGGAVRVSDGRPWAARGIVVRRV